MSNIRLTDNFGLAIDVTPDPASCFVKYFAKLPGLNATGLNIRALGNVAIKDVPPGSVSIGLSFQEPVNVGTGGTELEIGTGVSGKIAVYQKGVLFEADDFGDPVPIAADEAYVAIGITASVSPGISAGSGVLSFGVTPGGEVAVVNYRNFKTTPSAPTVVAALSEALSHWSLPCSIEDLESLESGTVVTVEGIGTLKFSATANLLSSLNPLATLAVPVLPTALRLTEGESFQVTASFELSTGYQIRVRKLTEHTVSLGYYRKHGTDFEIGASAEVGVTAGLGGFDLISALLGVISGNAQAEIDELKQAGLDEERISEIASAIKAGIERKLQLALSTELGAASEKEAAFLYEIDLTQIDAGGRRAVTAALHGDLTGLIGTETSRLPGVRPVRSIWTSLRQGSHKLRVNLLGIYNYISVTQLTSRGTVLYEPESGDLVITDTANAERIQSSLVNFAADRDRLRRVLAESFLITAVYRGTRFVARAPQLNSSYWYFELRSKTTWEMMRNDLDVPLALGILTEGEAQQMLARTSDFGRSAFYAETNYGEDLTTAFFLDLAGNPRSEDEYDGLGREALACLLHAGERDDFRLAPLQNDLLWKRMKDAGPAALGTVLPGLPPESLAVVRADYTLIRWWSKAMRKMGEKLAEIREFFARNPNPAPEDSDFKALRAQLAADMAAVAENTRDEFAQPWGLLAMDRASGSKSAALVRITGAVLSFERERPAKTGQLASAAAE